MAKKLSDNVVNPNARWFHKLADILEQLDEGKVNILRKISMDKFLQQDDAARLVKLKKMLNPLMSMSDVPRYGNILCFLEHSQKKFEKRASMEFDRERSNLHCWSCMETGKTLDIFDVIGIVFDLRWFEEKKLKAIELFVENGKELADALRVKSWFSRNATAKIERPVSIRKAFAATGRIYKPFEEDEDCKQYLEQRGITPDSANKFQLKCWEYEGNKYLVIPCDDRFYTRRKFITGLGDYPKFWKPKGSTVSLFNGKALEQEHSIVFVLESAIDAITMDQLGFPAIALNGKEHYGPLVDKADAIRSKDITLIMLMDNDNEGIKAGEKIASKLQTMGVLCFLHRYQKKGITIADFLTTYKDINNAYLADPSSTKLAVEHLYNFVRELRLIKPAKPTDVMKSYPNPLEQFGRAEVVDLPSRNKSE